jgi:hypothetical protein
MASINQNKLRGTLAEISFRQYVSSLGFEDHVSEGGWIVRSAHRGNHQFGQNTAVFFPETVHSDLNYPPDRQIPSPRLGLHSVCTIFHQIGIQSYYCAPIIERHDGQPRVHWQAIQLGRPDTTNYQAFPDCIPGFNVRIRRYNFESHHNDVSSIPDESVPIEFSKESTRVAFHSKYFCEPSDVDGLFWGERIAYPIEIKEKTRATNPSTGDFFGIDVGPFVKLAFYAAKRGNLHSLFVVREIDNENTRNLVAWRYITFDIMAQFASWVPLEGGRGMTGGVSSTVKIPVDRFKLLDAQALSSL